MKARALQMASETLPDHGNKTEACRHMGGLLGIGPETSRARARQEDIGTGQFPGVACDAERATRRLKQ